MENGRVIEAPADRNQMTQRETAAALKFIDEHKAQAFFLYLPHNMPGSSRQPFSSKSFSGKSKNGAWGDAVEELDWALGQILKALKKHHIDKRTLVLWTSDNGAPRRNPPQGSNGPLGGWGYTTAEGGMRVPCIVRWPGSISAGSTCDELSSLMDLLPTFSSLSDANLKNRKLDGKNIWPLWSNPKAKSPHAFFFYYHTRNLQAVRDTRWKLTLQAPPKLYDLKKDPGETQDLAHANPRVVRHLQTAAVEARSQLGDGEQTGTHVRPVGRAEKPTPLVK
jgi:arylsulfatase A-like enzyme